MGLSEGGTKGRWTKVLLALAAVFVFIVLIVGGAAYLYFREKDETTVPAEGPAPTTTVKEKYTLEVPEILKPVKKAFYNLKGGVECGEEEECYHETAEQCIKSETTYQTLQATQLRRILGEKNGRCIIYFENIDINRELTTEKWLGLNMTCLIDPEDTDKDFITEVKNPECTGSLWDALQPYVKKK